VCFTVAVALRAVRPMSRDSGSWRVRGESPTRSRWTVPRSATAVPHRRAAGRGAVRAG